MGAADVVPGVSGGTVAFITGIYEELLGAIKSVDAHALRLLLRGRWAAVWQHVNGNFLLTLFAGIGVSVLSLAKLLLFLLDGFPILVWAFFFGLILASAWVVGRKVGRWSAGVVALALVGTALAYFITQAVPAQTPEALWFVFLTGAVAICAMILPGISGSFILVLMGKYRYVLGAVEAFRVDVIAVFMVGCVVGLLAFSRLLSWLLARYYDLTIAVLTGFMVGSLNKVWPWKYVLDTYFDRHGVERPLREQNVLPHVFSELTHQDAQVWIALPLAVMGFLLVYTLERYTRPISPVSVVSEQK